MIRDVLCPCCGGDGAIEGHDGFEYVCRFCPTCEYKYQMDMALASIFERCNFDDAKVHEALLAREDYDLLAYWQKSKKKKELT